MKYLHICLAVAWPLAAVAGSAPLSAQSNSESDNPDYEIFDRIESTTKKRTTIDALEAVIASRFTGIARTIGLSAASSARPKAKGFFIFEVLRPSPLADGSYYLEFEEISDIQARASHECAQASRTFSRARFERAVAGVEGIAAISSQLYKDRVEQHRQFWVVSRYQHNVTRCFKWFESGRTTPFIPG